MPLCFSSNSLRFEAGALYACGVDIQRGDIAKRQPPFGHLQHFSGKGDGIRQLSGLSLEILGIEERDGRLADGRRGHIADCH